MVLVIKGVYPTFTFCKAIIMANVAFIKAARKNLENKLTAVPSLKSQNLTLLLNQGFQLQFNELLSMNVSNSEEAFLYWLSLLIWKYEESCPTGFEISLSYADWFLMNFDKVSDDFISYFLSYYASAFGKELRHCQSILEICQWAKIIKKISQGGKISVEVLKFTLINAAGMLVGTIIGPLIKNPDPEAILELIEGLARLQESGINIDSLVSSAVSKILNSIEKRENAQEKFNASGVANLASSESSEIMKALSKLEITDPIITLQKHQLNEILIFEGCINLQNLQIEDQPYDLEDRINMHRLDYSIWENKGCVYLSSRHPKFNVSIYHFLSGSGDVALKEYTAKVNQSDLSEKFSEIDTLTMLSARADPTANCFLKFYGYHREGNRLSLYMEYHQMTLIEKISEMQRSYTQFCEEWLTKVCFLLMSSYAEMEALGIYHRDIKPHNILYAYDESLKIIDFSISSEKIDEEYTGVNLIQGTVGYMAPELEESLRKNQKEAKYKISKADVFSLGLTILQMYTLQNLSTLNSRQNHERLIEKVNEVRIEWLRTLLGKMLRINYNERPSFRECLQDIPRLNTTIEE
jgi:serine/threonine protein kinase